MQPTQPNSFWQSWPHCCPRGSTALSIAIVSWMVILPNSSGMAGPPATHGFGDDFKDFSIEAEASTAEILAPALIVAADLGSLRSGDRGIATITIHNPLKHDIPISSARASCSCALSKLLAKQIPAGGSVQLVVALTVPAQNSTADFVGTISLIVDRDNSQSPTLREVSVKIRYTISGMLSFIDRGVSIAVLPDEKRTLLVPFIATIPGVPESLEIDGSGFLLGVPGSLVEIDDKWFVKLEISSEDGSPEGVSGQLKLLAKEHNVSATLNMLLYLENVIQVSPRTLRFRSAEGGLEASAVLHFSNSQEAERDRSPNLSSKDASQIFCEAFVSGKKLKVQVQSISKNVHRLKLTFDDSKEELYKLIENANGKREISWNIVSDNKRHVYTSGFTLSP